MRELELTPSERNKVKEEAIKLFGEAVVKDMDKMFLEVMGIRIQSSNNMEFIAKVREKYPDQVNGNTLGTFMATCLLVGMAVAEDYMIHQFGIRPIPKKVPMAG
jgi:hypothetical protein